MIQAICWVLIHSLWQGVLLSLAGGGVILCTKRSAAAVRYRLLCGLFGLFAAGMAATFFYEWGGMSGIGEGGAVLALPMNWLAEWCSAHAYSIVLAWLVMVVFKSVRMATGWRYIRRMRREGLAAPSLWAGRVAALSRKLGVRRTVKLVESGFVKVPVVIGQLKPIIYIPLGLINHLPPGEMEAVLLHELAHVRRYDYVVNMVQQAAECLLFFNPGFLWISYLMREERENCCDDAAIGCTQDRVEFVRALVRFKEHSLRGAVLAFPGNRRQLLHRVLRISRRENKTLSGRERLILLAGCVLLLGMFAVRVERVAGRPAALLASVVVPNDNEHRRQAVPQVSPELASVLQTRQQVAQNMEWVQDQLKQLHRQPNGHPRGNRRNKAKEITKEEKAVNDEDDQATAEEQAQTDQQPEAYAAVEVDRAAAADQATGVRQARTQQGPEDAERRGQVERDRQQAETDREQAERDRQQADRDREQADRDRQQAMRDREQAERDRARADLNRLQAERDREQALRERQAAEVERAKQESQRKQAESDRQKHKVIDQHQ
ncbi:MAG TPA: M56 family metallopeptidase [Puia sp.]|nr:M56 family metallopeptidase [Puia sp.]